MHASTLPSVAHEEIYLHPLPVRIWHWINATGFVLLILTGIQLRYGDVIGLMSYETTVDLHNWIGFAVIGNYFLWLLYYMSSDRITNYHPVMDAKNFITNFFRQFRYYSYGIFRGEESPHHVKPYEKFNPMQRLAYQQVMLIMVPIQFLTGLVLWDVERFAGIVNALGGIRIIATLHVVMFIAFVAFVFIHAYMGALGKTAATHYKEMITGYEEPE